MAKKVSAAWVLMALFSTAAGGTWGCSYLTGVPVRQRWESFVEKTIRPMWRHPNAKETEPELLEWIAPERADNYNKREPTR